MYNEVHNKPLLTKFSIDENSTLFLLLESLISSIDKPALIFDESYYIGITNQSYKQLFNLPLQNGKNNTGNSIEKEIDADLYSQISQIKDLRNIKDKTYYEITLNNTVYRGEIKPLPTESRQLFLLKLETSNHPIPVDLSKYMNFAHFMIDNFPFAAWLKDISGKFRKVNKKFAQFYSTEIDNMIGKSDYDFCSPELAGRYLETDKWILENKRDIFFGADNYDHRHHWIETYKSPVFDVSGNVVGILGFARQLDDKFFNLEQLKDNEEKFRSVISSLSEGLIIFNHDGTITEINPTAEQLFAIPAENLIGKQFSYGFTNCFKEDGTDFIETDFPVNSTLRDGVGVSDWVMGLTDVNGLVSWLKINTVPLFKSGTKELEFVVCTISDITRQKRIQKALLESREFMEKMNNASPNLIMLYDTENKRILYINNQSQNYFGLEPALIKNFPMEMLRTSIEAPDSQNFTEIIEEFFQNTQRKAVQKEIRIRHQSGRLIWVLANFVVFLRNDNKKPVQILVILTDINEKKNAELLVEESERRYRILAGNITDVISIIKPDLTFEYVSPSLKKMFGLEPADLINKPIDLIFTHGNFAVIKNLYLDDSDRILNKSFEKLVLYHDMPNGKKLWTETILNPILNDSGNIVRLIAVTREVTAQYTAIEKQRRIEQRYQNLFYNMYDGFVKCDLNGKILEFNNAFMSMLDYDDPGKLTGRNVQEITPEYYHVIEESIIHKHVFKKGFSEVFIKEYYKRGGGLVPVELRLYLIDDDSATDGKSIWAFVRDITERRRTELLLKESENRFRSVVEHSPVTIAVTTSDGIIEYVNRAGGELTGYDPSELMGRPIDIFAPDENQRRKWQAYHRIAFKKRNAVPIELQIKKRNGGIVYGLFQPALYVSHDTKLKQMNFVIDITERKGAELKLLESEVKLKEAIYSKDKFFSIIAHDLRSPLSGLVGLLKLLVRDFDSIAVNDIYELSRSLLDSADNLYRLLENLLEWSRVQRNKVKVELEIQNIDPLLKTAVNLFRLVSQNKEISLELESEQDLVAKCDSNITYSILRNLISNAIKFTNRGGSILLKASYGEPGFIVISVHDTGIGISPEKADELFRFDNYYSEKGTENESGSGLGLILCKELVELQGGTIWLESEKDKGSKFYFTVPTVQ